MSVLKSRNPDNEDNWDPVALNTPSQLYVGATEPLDPNVKIWVDTSKNSQTSSDYVVEQGTDGIWTYRKWNSGIAECWGVHNQSNANINNAWGSAGFYLALDSIPFPISFIDEPVVSLSAKTNMGQCIATIQALNNTAVIPFVWRGTSLTGTVVTTRIYAIGTWK